MSDATATVVEIGALPPRDRLRVEVVAVVLSDGSLLEVPDSVRQDGCRGGTRRLANGTISGAGWTLWWERRVYEETAGG